MYNNISLEREKKALKDSLEWFDKENEKEMRVYRIFEDCIKDETDTKQMLEKLNSIGDLKEYNDNFRNFLYARIKDLELLEKNEKEIEDLKREIVMENEKLEENLKKRNVRYDDDIEKMDKSYRDNSYTFLEGKKSKEELQKDLEILKEKNRVIEEEEKKSGEEFNNKLNNQTNSDYVNNSTHNEQMKKIQEDAYKNKKFFNNPDLDYVKGYYNDYVEKQTPNSKIDIEINYDNNKVDIVLSYKGTEVNENIPSVSFSYVGPEQMNYYYDEIYPFLLKQHVIDSDTNVAEDGSHLESKNSNNETLAVNASPDEVIEVGDDINKEVERKKGIVRKREFNIPDSYGFNNIIIFIVSIVLVIAAIILVIYFQIFN